MNVRDVALRLCAKHEVVKLGEKKTNYSSIRIVHNGGGSVLVVTRWS